MRLRAAAEEKGARGGGLYFANPSPDLSFIPSGSALLDCVLGGGWVLGRMSNIIGDFSTAKTGLTIEAMASFAAKYPKGHIFHREVEAAFDASYAETMGFPKDRVTPWEKDHDKPLETVEDIFEDLRRITKKIRQPALYIVDSWDALTDKASQEREIGQGSFQMTKQKETGNLFRDLCRNLSRTEICLLIVSQVREAIGVSFGEKLRRSGGKALDFYASHCLWLANAGKVKKKIGGQDEVTAIKVRARCKKNKVGLSYKECTFTYRSGYGIDEVTTCAEWLDSLGRLHAAVGYKDLSRFIADAENLSDEEYRDLMVMLGAQVRLVWGERQKLVVSQRRKYP